MGRTQWMVYAFATFLWELSNVGGVFELIHRIRAGEPYTLNLSFLPITATFSAYLLFKIARRSRKKREDEHG